jgi:hypothetical protein
VLGPRVVLFDVEEQLTGTVDRAHQLAACSAIARPDEGLREQWRLEKTYGNPAGFVFEFPWATLRHAPLEPEQVRNPRHFWRIVVVGQARCYQQEGLG